MEEIKKKYQRSEHRIASLSLSSSCFEVPRLINDEFQQRLLMVTHPEEVWALAQYGLGITNVTMVIALLGFGFQNDKLRKSKITYSSIRICTL